MMVVPGMNEMSIAKILPDRHRPAYETEPKSGYKLTPIAEVMKRTLETDWIIKGYLPEDSTVMIFGKSSSGKSLIAMEMAYCIGIGEDYCGCPVKQGSVIYIAGEGQAGIKKRFKAPTVVKGSAADNIHVSDLPMDLCSVGSLEQVVEAIAAIPDILLIVIDTLDRNSTGDENSAKDFAIVMQSCDQLRVATGATILLVHQ
jgi:putative DNA primase/helicase